MTAQSPLKIVFFGSPEFAVPTLERVCELAEIVAVVSQPDRPAGRGQVLTPPAVKLAAARVAPGVPILQPEKVRTPELAARLGELRADLFVVVAYGRILPQTLLDLPRHGAFNLHASLLPRWRGAAPIQWSIISGDALAGVCLMKMEAGLDTGPVAARAEEPILDDDTTATLSPRLARLGAEMLGRALPAIADGSLALTPQPAEGVTLAPPLRKEDGHLDFRMAATAISARARGVEPWPGAMATLAGQPIKLFAPRVVDPGRPGEANADAPGTVLGVDASLGVRVACGEGVIAFAEVQLAGRKRLSAAAVAAGRALARGAVLV